MYSKKHHEPERGSGVFLVCHAGPRSRHLKLRFLPASPARQAFLGMTLFV